MKIEKMASIGDALNKVMSACPEIKAEMDGIARAEDTIRQQGKKTGKSTSVEIKKSSALEFYGTVKNEVACVYHVTEITENDVETVLLSLILGIRNMRPLAIFAEVPQDGFQVSDSAVSRISKAAHTYLQVSAPKGRGLELLIGVYQRHIADDSLRFDLFF